MGIPFELYLAILICLVGLGAAAVAARRRRSFERAVAAIDLGALERLARASIRGRQAASDEVLGRALHALLSPLSTQELVRLGNGTLAGEAPFARLVFSTAYTLLAARRRGADREALRRQRWPLLATSFLPPAGPSSGQGPGA